MLLLAGGSQCSVHWMDIIVMLSSEVSTVVCRKSYRPALAKQDAGFNCCKNEKMLLNEGFN
jgi:hypothetical protein